MNRSELLYVLDAALANGQPRFARETAQAWLTQWPGDLRVARLLARAYRAEGNVEAAANAFERVASADPEDVEAQRGLSDPLLELGRTAEAATALACAFVLTGEPEGEWTDGLRAPSWTAAIRQAAEALSKAEWEKARGLLDLAVLGDPATPLPFVLHLRSFWRAGLLRSAEPLAEAYRKRWPRVVVFHLALAECLLERNEAARAVELIHSAATLDAGGDVASRVWGVAHPYRSLWPSHPVSSLPCPIPADVAAALGVNRLPAARAAVRPMEDKAAPPPEAEVAAPKTAGATAPASAPTGGRKPKASPAGKSAPSSGWGRKPAETLIEIEAELNRVAEQIGRRKRDPDIEDRRPAYILLSSKTRLLAKFGEAGTAQVAAEIERAAARLARQHRWHAYSILADEPGGLEAFGLRPVNPGNAWDVKQLLADLDAALAGRKEMIGALLIVGGDDIVPFHRLPNPTDDHDDEVPSDNPYGTLDQNYFVPEWPVGRLPAGKEGEPDLLLKLLRRVGCSDHRRDGQPLSQWLMDRLRVWLAQSSNSRNPSFGYSASIWKPASLEVFASIGEPRRLVTSPPVNAGRLPPHALSPSRLSYFNLHGIEDGAEWYGQRPPDAPDDGLPEYPVAIRPADVVNSGRAPEVVFSEACYGANAHDKALDEAMCLKFLASGSRAVVGSTKIAYGSITPPLIGADLLSKGFWTNLLKGLPAGEALRRAKLWLAQEMHRRQGYLDGEDQKTLISFVFYGDPLQCLPGIRPYAKHSKDRIHRKKTRAAPMPALDSRPDSDGWTQEVDEDTLAQVKSIVAQYLPGMGNAEMRVWERARASRAKATSGPAAPNRKVVSLSKVHRIKSRAHPQIARLTLDENGKVVKLAVSR